MAREVVRPDNQLKLTEAELEEEMARMLTANNPAAPRNVVRFNMKERAFKLEPMVEQTISHYATDGWLIHKGSEEAKRQAEAEREAEAGGGRRQVADAGVGGDAGSCAGGEGDSPDEARHLRNQFNFSERAAQTLNYPLRERASMTEPPPTATVSGACAPGRRWAGWLAGWLAGRLAGWLAGWLGGS
jgi:dynein intermediate chain 1